MLPRTFSELAALRDRLLANRSAVDLGAFISRHPLGAVGIAVLAGAAVGMITKRADKHVGEDGRSALLATIAVATWRFARRAALDFAATRAQDWVQDQLGREPHAVARDQSTFH